MTFAAYAADGPYTPQNFYEIWILDNDNNNETTNLNKRFNPPPTGGPKFGTKDIILCTDYNHFEAKILLDVLFWFRFK